jgi:hypothetical protein
METLTRFFCWVLGILLGMEILGTKKGLRNLL